MRLTFDEFERLVVTALDELPEGVLQHLDNVDVVIEDRPSEEHLDEGDPDGGMLLGLYEGIPHVDRVSSYGLVLPDKITIFRGPILEEADESGKPVERIVRETVVHEIAHHFGITDERLIEIDRY